MANKWQIGPVKLVNGEEAFIDAINEGQDHYRYTGRIRDSSGRWIASGWHATGLYMYADTDHSYNLSPPPKKTVRVQAWLNVDSSGGWRFWHSKEHADAWAHANRIACKEIDIEVTEGEADNLCNLAPPPKKTMLVRKWLVIHQNGMSSLYFDRQKAIAVEKDIFALIEIDREVTEGEGL